MALLCVTGKQVCAQAVPSGGAGPSSVGFQLPTVGGSLTYALNASELISTGFGGNKYSSTTFSGDLAFLSDSQTHPFSMVYSGGYLFSTSGQPSAPFQNVSLSQVFKTRKWNFVLADSASYLPDTPLGGLSGIAGLGDLGISPVQLGLPTQGVITPYETRVSNNVSGTIQREITGKTSVQGTGSYFMMRFLGKAVGVDSDVVTGGGGVTHRIGARNSLSGNYSYSQFSYLDTTYGFKMQSASLEFSRQVSRRLSVDLSGGPEWVDGSPTTFSRKSTDVTGNVALSYKMPQTGYNLTYGRAVNAGSGVIEGLRSDSVIFYVHHAFNKVWAVAGNVSIGHSSTLPNFLLPAFTVNSGIAGIQANRRLSRDFGAFASYTFQKQSVSGPGAGLIPEAFDGTGSTFGFGVSYTPAPIHLR